MKAFKFKSHIAFLCSIPLILIYGISHNYGPFDNGTHDTPVIMNQLTFAYIGSIIFLFFGLGYWKLNKNNGTWLAKRSWIHWILSFGSFLSFWLSGVIKYKFSSNSDVSNFLWAGRFDKINTTLLIIMIILHFFFIFNIGINKFKLNGIRT